MDLLFKRSQIVLFTDLSKNRILSKDQYFVFHCKYEQESTNLNIISMSKYFLLLKITYLHVIKLW